MATYRPKVLSTTGGDELLKDADNIKLVAAPTDANHGVNKGYTDTEISTAVSAEASARSSADTTLQGNIDAEETARIAADNALQAEIDTINGSGTNNLYVKRSGDDMSGNLTLGTDKITLNATSGSAEFASQIIVYPTGVFPWDSNAADQNSGVFLGPDGRVNLYQLDTETEPYFSCTAVNSTTGALDTKAVIYNNGAATFSGSLEAASIDGGTY